VSYLREFVSHWPNLLGAALGLAFGSAFNHYMMNLFGPALIAEFGWSKAQYALVGALGFASIVFTPVAGLIVDRFGARLAATVGFAVLPLSYLLLSLMSGNIYHFYAILLFKNCFAILTTTMTFTRVVVERFDRARGLALACLLSAPPLAGAIGAPLIGGVIAAEGWRAAYLVMAAIAAVAGLAAILLVGRRALDQRVRPPRMDWKQLRELSGNPVFPLLLAGMFLVNFPQVLVSSQMNVMLMESGATMGFATALISLYATCVIIGRFVGGFALDRVSPHLVAIVFLGLPAVGYVMLASAFDDYWVLAGSMALVGLAQGAETDVAAMLTSRRFDISRYSFVMAMLITAMGLASAFGSTLLSITLVDGGNFNTFLLVSAVATLGGALCFFLTGRTGADRPRTTEGAV
jgi:predicted MFS family arabinose efflux permease